MRLHVDAPDVVIRVVGDVHVAAPVEPDAVADAAERQLQEDASLPVRRYQTDRPLPLEVDGVDVPGGVASGTLRSGGEDTGLGEHPADIQLTLRRAHYLVPP